MRITKQKISDFIAIKVFLLAGTVAMVSFGSYVLLGIEVLSILIHFSSKQ
jgi:NADH-quinone oxidoreductase subunit N